MAFGIIRQVATDSFDENVWEQIEATKQEAKFNSVDELMNSGVTWEI